MLKGDGDGDGDGDKNGKKKSIDLISKKKKLCPCSTLFCTFLCCCFARLQRETSYLHVL